MYNNESYEDYIRSILGYPNYSNNSLNMTNYGDIENEQDSQLETCYPEIYKVIYPMVNKACNTNTKPVTPKLIDELTDEIYYAVENDNNVNVTINLTNEVQSTGNRNASNNVKTENSKETRENRQFRNRSLQDLIRILLIRELLRRRRRFPGNRPSFPPNRPPMIPPFPGGPGGGRPPIMPRSNYYNDINDIYE